MSHFEFDTLIKYVFLYVCLMKQFFFLSIFFFSTSLLAQQNWDLFPLNQETWFSQSDSIRKYYNDSIINTENESIHLFGVNYLYSVFGQCTDEIVPEFWENEGLNYTLAVDTLFSNDDFYFSKVSGDTLKFHHLALPGDSWDIPTVTNDTFRLTCSTLIESDLFGFSDSLKTFDIQFIQNGNELAHPLNGQQYILSKQSGFTQFISFQDLYFASETSTLQLIQGMIKEEIPYGYTSTFEDYFHYEIGDVLKWHSYDRSSPETEFNVTEEWFIDTITGMNFINNQLRLNVNRTIYTEVSENGILVDNYTEVGTTAIFSISQIFMDSLLNAPAQHPVAIFQNLRYLSKPAKIEDLGIVRTADFISPKMFSLLDCSTDPTDSPPGKFVINTTLGITNNLLERGEEGNYFLEILGYKSADFMWGELNDLPIISSIENFAESGGYEVYPNPANNLIHISFPQDVNNVDFSVYNLQGKLIMQKEITLGENISVTHLPEGLYLLNLKNTDTIHQKKIYISHSK